jgi:AcrR family transcriptional regulator
LGKTTIEDLTRRAGIAKGSFYLFFDSKEALYVQLLLDEAPAMMERIAAASVDVGLPARETLIQLLRAIVAEMEGNPFARALLDDPGQLAALTDSIDVGRLLEQAASLFEPILGWLVEAQRRGELRSGDPQELFYALALIKLLPLHKGRIPEAIYERMVPLISEILADGLTCVRERREEM